MTESAPALTELSDLQRTKLAILGAQLQEATRDPVFPSGSAIGLLIDGLRLIVAQPPVQTVDLCRPGGVPHHVIVDTHGTLATGSQARAEGLESRIVYVRADGWALGAPLSLDATVRRVFGTTWAQIWARVRPGPTLPHDLGE